MAPASAMEMVDAHCHYWQLARGDYGWLREDVEALAPIHRDFGPADLPQEARQSIRARILVQAAPTIAETRYLLDLAGQHDEVAGVVGWVDLSAHTAVANLEELAGNRLFKGVRPMLQDLPDADWIATRPRQDALGALSRLGLRFDALVTPLQLDALVRFVAANPQLPVIIDHAAKPAFAAPADDPRHEMWARGMARLAGFPAVCCKLSGLLTELPADRRKNAEQAAASLRPTFDRLLDWFGPQRIAWGTDWPVLTLAAGYGFWLEVTEHLLDGLDREARAQILGRTAARFYATGGGGS